MTGSIVMIALAATFLLFVLFYPYVWGCILKAKMLKKLMEDSDKLGYKYRKFYKSIFFVHNRSQKYDFVIYNEERLYAVKLWSSYYVNTNLLVSRDGKAREFRRTRHVFSNEENGEKWLKGISYRIKPTRLDEKYKRGREVVRVLLIYPSYKRVIYNNGTTNTRILGGEKIMDKLLFSPFSFTNDLKKNALLKDTDKMNEKATENEVD